jgi:hypothetical protein
VQPEVARRLGLFIAVTGGLLSALGAAGAATPQRAEFRVTLTATLTKEWRHVRVVSAQCTRTTTHRGEWRLTLAARRASRVVIARPATSGGRLRISPATVGALAGQAQQRGGRDVLIQGPRCPRESTSVRCGVQRRSFRGASARLTSPARGRARFTPLRGAGRARSFRRTCPEEPVDISSLRTDLALADAPLAAADVFDPTVTRFFISGNTEQVTTLSGPYTGRVTERVRWTLTFTRLR